MEANKKTMVMRDQVMTDKEILLQEANKAYREGNPIMGDAEYDALEAELNLENKNSIGEKHSPELTVRHPFIMGSLSKIQVHKEKNGKVDWENIYKQIKSFVGDDDCIITPKYDGCSFEVYIENGKLVSISTRGDGLWGRDVSKFIKNKIPEKYLKKDNITCTLRGEMLIRKNVFEKKYLKTDNNENGFVNPRAWVAGVTGRDWSKETEQLAKDLDIVIYDFREMIGDDPKNPDNWVDIGWENLVGTEVLPDFYNIYCKFIDWTVIERMYAEFEAYRGRCEYALDGFVIKPLHRKNDFVNERPKDCVAIKFLPMTADTEIERIEWSLGKTGEYAPIVYYKPVYMDGKKCIKASGHNYGWLVERGVAPTAKVTISMAGDIIPYIYKVLEPAEVDNINDIMNLPENCYVDGVHLMKKMSDDEIRIEMLRNSCKTVNIHGLGDAQIQKIIDGINSNGLEEAFFDIPHRDIPVSIFQLNSWDVANWIGGSNGAKIMKEMDKLFKEASLELVIESLNYRFCGKRVSKAIADYLLTGKKDFDSMATEGYEWVFDKGSDKYVNLLMVLNAFGKDINYYKTLAEQINAEKSDSGEKTYIIMTGEPNTASTKGEFLKIHPEYEETTSWKKVQIVFTNSLDSNTGKMKKAREKGIEIRLY